jgi:antitoxin VapB
MGFIKTKTFKSGNSVALRLPKSLGIKADVAMQVEQRGRDLVIRAVVDPVEEKRLLMELIAELDAIGPVGEIEKREPIYFPDRPGLY